MPIVPIVPILLTPACKGGVPPIGPPKLPAAEVDCDVRMTVGSLSFHVDGGMACGLNDVITVNCLSHDTGSKSFSTHSDRDR